MIHDLAATLAAQFPPGSTQHPTAATPAVWQNWTDFVAKAQALKTAADKLMNTKPDDSKAIVAQVRAVAQACSNCHETYRVKKK
jgi:cytochrome c556